MTDCEWIICERTGRWAAALRKYLSLRAKDEFVSLDVLEVRSLNELSARLDDQPTGIALVEVRAANFEVVLAWITEAGNKYPTTRCVALVDPDLSASHPLMQQDAVAALFEAGAADIVRSSRQLNRVLSLGQGSIASRQRAEKFPSDASFSESAWAALPWQAT